MRLIAQAVGHRYETGWVLADIDLEVHAGEAVAITGPSGVGKSTLLAILGGILLPTKGTVLQVGPDGPLPHLDVAWILQTRNALGSRTVWDNVRLGVHGRGLDRSEAARRVEEAIVAVGLTHRRDAAARTLSGGELQRVSIARAMASGAPFMLADEPTGELDDATTDRVLDALFPAASGPGLLVATHDRLVAARCDRVLTLRDRRLHPG